MKTNRLVAGLAALSLVLASGCCRTKTGAARVNCGSLSMYQGEVGTLNTPQLKLGHVITLSPHTKRAFPVGLFRPATNQIDFGSTIEALAESFKSQFTVDFDATIPQSIQVRASNVIAKTSVLVITNLSRHDILNPLEFLNQNSNAVNQIQANSAPSNHLIFVTTMIPATYLKLASTNSLHASASVDVIKVGNYNLHLSYSCNDELLRVARDQGSGAFFKYIPIQASSNRITFALDFSERLSDYDFSSALR